VLVRKGFPDGRLIFEAFASLWGISLGGQVRAAYYLDGDGTARRGKATTDGGETSIADDRTEFVSFDLLALVIG
jgi:hypothetical protein